MGLDFSVNFKCWQRLSSLSTSTFINPFDINGSTALETYALENPFNLTISLAVSQDGLYLEKLVYLPQAYYSTFICCFYR